MGQPITVVEKSSSTPGIVRFETNRPLSGTGHEHYTASPSDLLDRPVDELARRLFDAGGIETVHINGSMVTVGLARGGSPAGLGDIIRSLFLHYGANPLETVAVPAPEEDAAPATLADTADAPSAQAASEPAAADPPAPEVAGSVDAATTEPGAPGALPEPPSSEPIS